MRPNKRPRTLNRVSIRLSHQIHIFHPVPQLHSHPFLACAVPAGPDAVRGFIVALVRPFLVAQHAPRDAEGSLDGEAGDGKEAEDEHGSAAPDLLQARVVRGRQSAPGAPDSVESDCCKSCYYEDLRREECDRDGIRVGEFGLNGRHSEVMCLLRTYDVVCVRSQ